jgi:predicted DNA-binding transcriptional regulator YafY
MARRYCRLRKTSFRVRCQASRVLETSARLLRLLSLLQARRNWSGPELAERLSVSTRTIRNDMERLRSLGYPMHATPGAAGGAGAALPPLLLDDEEAVAVAVGLRTAAAGTVTGIEATSIRALSKLEQVMPSRLRHKVNAVAAYTVPVAGRGPAVRPQVLMASPAPAAAHERLRFDYRDHDGSASPRTVEPHRLVRARGRWYLAAWDVDRQDGRTFRVGRIKPRIPTGPRFAPRDPPGGDDGLRRARRRRSDVALPGEGARARAGRGDRPAATRGGGRGRDRRPQLHGQRRVGHPPAARRLPGNASTSRTPRARRLSPRAFRAIRPRDASTRVTAWPPGQRRTHSSTAACAGGSASGRQRS